MTSRAAAADRAEPGFLSPEEFTAQSIFPAFSINVPMPQRGTAGASITADAVPIDRAARLQQATLLQKLGDAWKANGDNAKAIAHYEASLAIMNLLVEA